MVSSPSATSSPMSGTGRASGRLRHLSRWLDAGISPNNIILDPGFGFAKTTEQNMELLGGLGAIRELGYPLLVGVSRKSMIYLPLGITSDEALAG